MSISVRDIGQEIGSFFGHTADASMAGYDAAAVDGTAISHDATGDQGDVDKVTDFDPITNAYLTGLQSGDAISHITLDDALAMKMRLRRDHGFESGRPGSESQLHWYGRVALHLRVHRSAQHHAGQLSLHTFGHN
jgi:hypothetical protein